METNEVVRKRNRKEVEIKRLKKNWKKEEKPIKKQVYVRDEYNEIVEWGCYGVTRNSLCEFIETYVNVILTKLLKFRPVLSRKD